MDEVGIAHVLVPVSECDVLSVDQPVQRLRAQLTAALALRRLLLDMGFENLPEQLDLVPLVAVAQGAKLLHPRAAGILLRLNRDANEANHALDFISCH